MSGKETVVGKGERAEEEVGERLKNAGGTGGADDRREDEENWERDRHSDETKAEGGGGGIGSRDKETRLK